MAKKKKNYHSNSLMLLSMLAFFLIATHAVSLSRFSQEEPPVVYASQFSGSLLPQLKDTTKLPILSAQGVIAIDLNSSVTLYEKDADLPLSPASTTKIMTALVAMDIYSLDMKLTVGPNRTVGQRMGLVMGEEITVRDLLDGLLIFSANDAAEVLAVNHPEGREGFIQKMNEKAKVLSMSNTHFMNPSGLDAIGHVSTARDMVRLSEVAMRNELLAAIVQTKEKTVVASNLPIKHRLTNINKLLGNVDGVLGVKTGWTEEARENLVTLVERNDKPVYIAVLGSQDRFGETTELIEWIYANYEWKEVKFTYLP